MAFPDDWNRKCAITIDAGEVDATLTDFPFFLTIANLPSEMMDADGSYPAQSAGGDVRFSSDSAGSNQLPCEIVSFATNANPASANAEIWVKVPSVSSSSDTTIYVWYNTAGTESQPTAGDTYGRNAVWSNDFLAVLHFHETSGDFVDSTGNGNDGVVDLTTRQRTGVVGDAANFDGTSFREVQLPPVLDGLSAVTVEGWFRRDSGHATMWSGNETSADNPQYAVWDAAGFFGGGTDVIQFSLDTDSGGDVWETSNGSGPANTWLHLAMGWDQDAPVVYLDGSLDTPSHAPITITGAIEAAASLRIGRGGGGNAVDGGADEFRVSSAKRPAAWIAATHSNTNAPGTFATAGTPEDAASPSTPVEPNDCTHAHSVDSPAISQVHAIAPNSATHAHTAESPTVSTVGTITPNDCSHAHTADSPAVTQTHSIAPNDASHAHTCESPTVAHIHVVTPADCLHSHTAESPVISQLHLITPADCLHAHTCESPNVTPEGEAVVPIRTMRLPARAVTRSLPLRPVTRTLPVGPTS